MDVEIRPLSPTTLGDYLTFFDGDAFADNPEWSSCYCRFHHADHGERPWETRTAVENRKAVCDLVAQGRMQGYLAYAEGRVVGWCHAAPRTLLPNLEKSPDLPHREEESVGSIACFLVAPAFRGRGVAGRLLEAALRGLARAGCTVAEAYPRRDATGCAAHYHGPLPLYRKAGFRSVKELEEFTCVRKDLRAAGIGVDAEVDRGQAEAPMPSPRLVLFAHGSRDPRWRAPFESLLRSVAAALGPERVRLAYMEFSPPSLLEIAAEARADGVRELRVLPLFLAAGSHVAQDIPLQAEEAGRGNPEIRITVLDPVGEHPRLAALLRELALEAAP